eukprot:SAG11_NODE_4571_length_1847_cov_3.699085_2_plen_181_part_00
MAAMNPFQGRTLTRTPTQVPDDASAASCSRPDDGRPIRVDDVPARWDAPDASREASMREAMQASPIRPTEEVTPGLTVTTTFDQVEGHRHLAAAMTKPALHEIGGLQHLTFSCSFRNTIDKLEEHHPEAVTTFLQALKSDQRLRSADLGGEQGLQAGAEPEPEHADAAQETPVETTEIIT